MGISIGARPMGITAGADGNLWFTEYDGNRIGRITPSGVVTEFSMGISVGARPTGITAGTDGNAWFTESNGNRIGRITPSGVVTEFGTASIRPSRTPRASRWGPMATCGSRNSVCSVSVAPGLPSIMLVRSAALRRAGRSPNSAGASVAALMASPSAPTATCGSPKRMATARSGGSPQPARSRSSVDGSTVDHTGIAAGPDGNLSFTEYRQRIGRSPGRLSPNSAPASPPVPARAITAGPDGNLWFTEEMATGSDGSPRPASLPSSPSESPPVQP